MKKIQQILISERGVSLYLSIVVLTILLTLTLGLETILLGQTKTIKGMGDSVAAFYAADTGVEIVLYRDKLCRQAPPCVGFLGWNCADTANCDKGIFGSSFSGNVGPASYTVTFNEGATTITSIGIYSGTRRAIQVTR